MALNKQKALDAAQKFLQKGQIDKAIAEYRKICEVDTEDLRSLQKLGDLYARQGHRQEAIATYMKLAEMLTARGFANRAVSIYKQILQLNPLLVPVYVKLSDLFRELGLSKDARIFNQRAIEILQKTGNQDDLLNLLKRIVEGDPDDAISRITLAETYLRVEDTTSAVNELQAALPLLREQKLDDLFIRAAERLLYHYPDNIELCRELAVLHLRRKEVPRAMKLLLFCRKKDPEDVKTMDLLASHFMATGETSKASVVLAEKAKVHRKVGETDELRKTYLMMLEIDPKDSQTRRALQEIAPDVQLPDPEAREEDPGSGAEIPIFEDSIVGDRRSDVQEVQEEPSEPVEPLSVEELEQEEPLQEEPAREGDPVSVKIIEEADIYLKYGLVDKALEHLQDALERTNDSPYLLEKLKDIYLDQGDMATAAEHALQLAGSWHQQGEDDRAEVVLKEILLVDAENGEAAEMLASLQAGESIAAPSAAPVASEVEELEDLEEIEELEPEEEEAEAIASPPQESAEPLQPVQPEDLDRPVSEAEYASFLDEETSDPGLQLPTIGEWQDEAAEIEATPEEPLADEVLEPDSQEEMARALDSVTLPELDLDDFTALEKETEDEGAPPPESPGEAIAGGVDELHALELETDEIDGPTVPDVFDEPLEEASAPPPAPPRRTPPPVPPPAPRAAQPPRTATEKSQDMDQLFPALDEKPAAAAAPAPAEDAATSTAVEEALEEAEFFISQGLIQEAGLFLNDLLKQFPGNRLIVEKLAELEISESAPETEPALFAEEPEPLLTSEEVEDVELESASQIADEAFDALSAIESIIQVEPDGSDALLGAQPTEIDPSDARTHYDLGIAYMEMGVMESAVQEFRIASSNSEMEALCYNMIGNCLMSEGRVEDAIKEYKLGLFAKNKSQDQELNLYYDIAESYIKLKDHREAIYYLQNIKKKDPGFKDVKLKLIALSSSYKPTSRASSQPPQKKPSPAPPRDPAEAAKEVDDAFDDLFGDFGGKDE